MSEEENKKLVDEKENNENKPAEDTKKTSVIESGAVVLCPKGDYQVHVSAILHP